MSEPAERVSSQGAPAAPKKSLKGFHFVLDALLVIVMATLYSKGAVNLMYHEVVGLVLTGLILIHVVAHWKWITGVSRKVFTGSSKARTAVSYVINVLLCVSWLACIVLGILVSKKIFHFGLPGSLVPWHFFTAALALLLTGVHVGLHWEWWRGKFGIRKPLPKAAVACLLVVFLAAGSVSFAVTDFDRWISAPFNKTMAMEHQQRETQQVVSHGPAFSGKPQGDRAGASNDRGGTDARGAQGGETGERHGQPFSWARFFKVIGTTLGELLGVAAVTRILDLGFSRLCRKKPAGQSA
ncbi:MAG: hypothetical protein IJ133_02090 [Clostridia bacterium]|nr:hypothetical protein [Clostridia bacterium]